MAMSRCVRWRAIGLAALTVFAAACAFIPQPETDAPPTSAALIEQGHDLAQLHCSRCHAIGTSGDSPFAPAPPFRTLSQRYEVGMLEEAFAEGVLVGHPSMPQFQFEPDQIDALVAYLESVQPKRGG